MKQHQGVQWTGGSRGKWGHGARLELDYNLRLNMRPWDKTLTVAVGRGFLTPGDTIIDGPAIAVAAQRAAVCRTEDAAQVRRPRSATVHRVGEQDIPRH